MRTLPSLWMSVFHSPPKLSFIGGVIIYYTVVVLLVWYGWTFGGGSGTPRKEGSKLNSATVLTQH